MEYKRPRQLYFKLFWTYTAIVIVVVGVLAGYFLTEMRHNALEQKQEAAQKLCAEAAMYVEDKSRAADELYKEIYRDRGLLKDMLCFLSLEPEEYQKHRLDEYSASNSIQYGGMSKFVTDAFETYAELKRVELLSYEAREITTFYPDEVVYPYKDGAERLWELTGDGNYRQDEELQFMKELRNPDTMEVTGCVVFNFNCKDCFKNQDKGRDYIDVMLVRNYRNIICSSDGIGEFRKILKKDADQEQIELPEYSVHREQADDYQVYVILNESKASYVEPFKLFAIVGVSVAALAVGILFIHLYLLRLNNRVGNIVRGMAQVTTGDLQVRLYVDRNGDELDIIASNFNEMCENLQTYIRKSYLAEIEAKNAQLEALQSQINPHFLYNTLEAIRMKAIVNGDRDVGKMLYSMSVLFRSQLKEADWITIGQELDYCKQYLELFECRFQGNFKYQFNCSVELMATKVIKFILQPILENYFVHGIRRQETDNYIHIFAEQSGEDVIFCVADNGIGMENTDIEARNRELRENRDEAQGQKKSVGITNVNRRIKAVYGDDYGLTLKSGKNGGIEVIIKVRLTQ